MKHEYKLTGSDTGRRELLAYCSCGWSGKVIDGQGYEAHAQAENQWRAHVEAAKQAEEQAA